MTWTVEAVELTEKMWKDGKSASVISAALKGLGLTLSRNAVLGKLFRAGIAGHGPNNRPTLVAAKRGPKPRIGNRPRLIPKRTTFPKLPPPMPIEELVEPISLNVSLLDLKDTMCKWPIGDPDEAGFGFCGHAHFKELPYCEYHARIAYQPVQNRQARQRQAEKRALEAA